MAAEQHNPEYIASRQNMAAERAALSQSVIDDLNFEDGGDSDAEAPDEQPDEAPEAPADDVEPEGEDTGEPSEEDPEAELEDAAAEDSDEEEPEDKDLAKRLAAIQKAEKRSREQVAKERREFQREREEFESERRELRRQREAFEAAAARVKYDPIAVLKSLGVDDADLGPIAKFIHYGAPTNTPENREAAARMMRERERDAELAEHRRWREEMEKREQDREAAREHQRTVETYLDGIYSAVGTSTPLVATLLENDRDELQKQVLEMTQYLIGETDEVPDASDVLEAIERNERKRLKKRGIDYQAAIAATKRKPADAGEMKSAKTLTNNLGTTARPKPAAAQSREEIELDVIANLPI